MNLNLKVFNLIDIQSKINFIKNLFIENLFIFCTFDCSFQYHKESHKHWVKEHGDVMVVDYDLVKINDHKSHFLVSLQKVVTVSNKQ